MRFRSVLDNRRKRSDPSELLSEEETSPRCDNCVIARRNSAERGDTSRANCAEQTRPKDARVACVNKCSNRGRIMPGIYLGSYARRRVLLTDVDSHTDRRGGATRLPENAKTTALRVEYRESFRFPKGSLELDFESQ